MTLLDFVRLTRAHMLSLVFLTLVGGAVAYGLTLRMPEVYVADASGYVRVEGTGTSTGDGIAATSLGGSKADSYLPLVTSRAVAQRVIEETGIQATPAAVAARVSASVAESSVIMKVRATGPSPEESRVLADALIRATATEANRIETSGEAASASIVSIVPIESALPGVQIAPNPRRNLMIGLAVGLAVAYGLVFLRRQLDTRVRSSDDVEAETGASVLGVVPMTKELRVARGRGRLDRLGIASEAFRQIRTNLRFVGVDDPPRSIVVTSANAHEGKSTVSATLARVLGEAGQSVVIIDADLRRPTLGDIFDAQGRVGLSHVLSDQVDLADAFQATDQENVRLITSGRTPPNPSELLGSARMQELVRELSVHHTVILDAPPLLPVTDAGVLASSCDGTLLVFAVGRTHREQARLVARTMAQVGGRVLGVVLNMAPRGRAAGVMYGYSYGYAAYGSDTSTQRRYASATTEPAHGGGGKQRRIRRAS
ncbi:polysaccharide biosynthesis tyrosine autokinase [Phycicoccus sp. CSK15P-2]|uniref:polysaccharide biosynthesis tyrosine autokinase n=1 Tax=Phycicoccus sp. CSK15P-2 TaxID=2807627 RepID=UPI001951B09F|nr:polysaccharide biosynthesis tyrosine autokinase [Phycicoccus sp. CSK15P-2]MBM6404322.1 polysaccharide biosynthesis tyrosine autokinase [Phycicoccus sp. CSK15P-2]